ncbi:amidohydrolase family protein [Ramlibacter rhizophilus]|uniref:2-pyrone-4,6-dicarboxylate hydrolase n=1 Tax=Ramlibacter rhizophilus TaxID=1781167 RepID=A0A4Z0BPI9_9BURK|nr:amidohydrolase family protein [Ramlibacter rhizophilus]TFY99888.1 2-pyrone-4,6-dicarboxylate hydrolase [Ramlibacter rhizophilus]
MSDYFPFHPEPRAPSRPALAGAIDSQFHILGPREKYPVRPGAAYEMPTATPEALQRVHQALGIRRGIIVQTTTYGEDHRVVLDALAALGPGYKACANALVFESASDAELQRLHDAGVRGARFSFRQALGAVLTRPAFDRAVGKLRELGWYMKVQPEQTGIVESVSWFEDLDLPVLIDHMGRPDATLGPDRDPNIAKLRQLLARGNFWVMLSLGEKISRTGAPYDDVVPLARVLIDAAPARCVWGSDWPHPVSKKPPPNDADLLELLYRYVRSEDELRRILVDNPAELFGYEALA